MLRRLIAKFKETPGPMQATRIMVGDLAEELLEIAKSYAKTRQSGDSTEEETGADNLGGATRVETQTGGVSPSASAQTTGAVTPMEPERVLPVSEAFARALDDPKNRKKQEFKVLAILWDAASRDMKAMSAQSVAEHGRKLGLVIRHENVRKIIRMRLDDRVEIMMEDKGTGSIYKYRLSEKGQAYFQSKYLIT